MQSFFKPTIEKICRCVKDILLRYEDVSAMILVGGYGTSAVLGERIRSTFEAKPFDVKVVIPDSNVRPQAAIDAVVPVRGGVSDEAQGLVGADRNRKARVGGRNARHVSSLGRLLLLGLGFGFEDA